MNKNDIPELAKQTLSGLLDQAGGILYSSHETLKPGDVYLMGFNPGGSGGSAIQDSINKMLTNTENSYLDEEWDNRLGDLAKGKATLQLRVDWMLKQLGLETRNVCASNLIFFQSRMASDINYTLADKCWPVHEAILEIVKPKLILVFGNSGCSPYGYLHNRFGGDQEFLPSGHGSWQAKGFSARINGHAVYIAGLPHLSRYDPGMASPCDEKSTILEWLNRKLKS